ncbi:hypothetical protein [Jeotgalibacillus terrae]|uniref:Aspartyl-phosphate phosphatase Spo0E family protein n=1 Tax=Jeotgalibacillus terrae TaxID=587735 RepID=A0ABW5ZG57_9BACL|nr:hypothetical protein [Jeotgalibacillus terrae]MBM7580734.1 hypothetical protein [Jeotgalibacillus terrae]
MYEEIESLRQKLMTVQRWIEEKDEALQYTEMYDEMIKMINELEQFRVKA